MPKDPKANGLGVEPEELQIARRILLERAGWKVPRDKTAFEAFNALVAKGCDARELALSIAVFTEFAFADTLKQLIGFENAGQLQTALKRMRKSAGDVEKVQNSFLGHSLLDASFKWDLPNMLRLTANVAKRAAEQFPPNSSTAGRVARAEIVRYVLRTTGKPLDRLVSSILHPTIHCDERAQAQWRSDNDDKIFLGVKTPDKNP